LNSLRLRGIRKFATVDCLEIYDGGVTAEIKDVLSDSAVSRAATLLAREMGEGVFDFHALT